MTHHMTVCPRRAPATALVRANYIRHRLWPWLLMLLLGCQAPWLTPDEAATGNFLKFYGGVLPDTLVDMAPAPDSSSTYLLGNGQSATGDLINLIEVDGAGNERRWRRWSRPGQVRGAFLLPLPNGLVVGVNAADSSGRPQPWLLRYDTELVLRDSLPLTTPDSPHFSWLQTAILTQGESALLIGGYSTLVDSLKYETGERTPEEDPRDAWLWQVRLTEQGFDTDTTTRWERRYGFIRSDAVVALSEWDGEYFALMETQYPVETTWSLLHLSAEGYLIDQWTQATSLARPVAVVTDTRNDIQYVVAAHNDDQRAQVYVRSAPGEVMRPRVSASDLVFHPGDATLSPDQTLWLSGLTADRRQLLTAQLADDALVLQSRSGTADAELVHQAGPLHVLAGERLRLGATIGWGNGNAMLALLSGQAGTLRGPLP